MSFPRYAPLPNESPSRGLRRGQEREPGQGPLPPSAAAVRAMLRALLQRLAGEPLVRTGDPPEVCIRKIIYDLPAQAPIVEIGAIVYDLADQAPIVEIGQIVYDLAPQAPVVEIGRITYDVGPQPPRVEIGKIVYDRVRPNTGGYRRS